jgi:hypothetical protein
MIHGSKMTSRALLSTILLLLITIPAIARVEPLRDDAPAATVLC